MSPTDHFLRTTLRAPRLNLCGQTDRGDFTAHPSPAVSDAGLRWSERAVTATCHITSHSRVLDAQGLVTGTPEITQDWWEMSPHRLGDEDFKPYC